MAAEGEGFASRTEQETSVFTASTDDTPSVSTLDFKALSEADDKSEESDVIVEQDESMESHVASSQDHLQHDSGGSASGAGVKLAIEDSLPTEQSAAASIPGLTVGETGATEKDPSTPAITRPISAQDGDIDNIENKATLGLSMEHGETITIQGESSMETSVTGPSKDNDDDDNDEDTEMGAGGSDMAAVGVAGPSGDNDTVSDNSYLDAAEYAYTKRDEFTSEIFKIEISNLPRNHGFKDFKKLIKNRLHNCKPVKVKLLPWPNNHGFVTFRNDSERMLALKALDGVKFKGKFLKTKLAKALPDPVAVAQQREEGMYRKRKIEAAADKNPDAKRAKGEAPDVPIDYKARLNDSVAQLWKLPYPEQLETKNKAMTEFMQKLTKEIKDMSELKGNWAEEASKVNDGLCCKLEPCIASPVSNGYRSKCEFTIAEGPDGEKTVGFRVGSYKEGYSGVVEPSDCIHIPDVAKHVAAVFQKYIRKSTLPVYDLCFHTGYWQTLTVRSTVHGENMAIIQWSPQTMTQPEIEAENQKIRTFFLDEEGKECIDVLTSLYSQPNTTRAVGTHANAPLVHLHGEKIIHEVLCDVKFRISPNAFFQVNTLAAQKMMELIKTWLGEPKDSILLDICCGTGSIGLCLAKHVSKVIGIEVVKSAVEDAEQNAKENGITNTQYICGKVEDVFISKDMKRLRRAKCVGILDPPRAGVHPTVIQAIRKYDKMDKLIYISCKAESAKNNFLELCRPTSKRVRTLPFRLVTAVPVDLFPHTKQVELCMLFERDTQSFDAVKYYKFYY